MRKLAAVLLVDDNATTNFLNERLLAGQQLVGQVLVATSGEEALAILTSLLETAVDQPFLVLLDKICP